jgi:HK97 family phage portal protein
MAAFARFPWVRACVDAIGEDLAGLPLRLTVGTGPNAEVIDAHPVLDLLQRPTSSMDRALWERQLVTYWVPSGSAVILMVGDREPVSLPLLHPEEVRFIADVYGQLAGVEYRPASGQAHYLAASALAIVRSSSWRPGAEALVGEGAISALTVDLNAEQNAARLAAKQAGQGRPQAVLSPAETGVMLNEVQRKAIATAYADFSASGAPALVLSGAVKAELPAFTLADMQFNEQRKLTRETVLAVLGVPPSRVGLPNANYATASAQERVYWTNLQARAALIDDALTRIARRFDPRLVVSHDFSRVPALQEARTERQNRVTTWVLLGADPAAAAAYEGFADAPLMEEPAAPADPATGDDTGKRSVLQLLRGVDESPALAALLAPEAKAAPVGEEARAEAWRSWVFKVHNPAETRTARGVAIALRAQRSRVLVRLEAVGLTDGERSIRRDLVNDIMAALFPAAETTTYGEELRALVRRIVMDGYADGAEQLGREWKMDGTAADVATDRQLGALVTNTIDTTRAAVRAEVLAGIDAGEGVNEISARLRALPEFGPARSLLIARTETTRSLGAGHEVVYQQYADEEGVTVRRQWLSARDAEVRDAHALLDGQERAIGEKFVIEGGEFAGASALAPGGFTEAALVCNCRCTTVPVVEVA